MHTYTYIDNPRKLEAALARLDGAKIVGCDIESTGLRWHQDRIIGVSWATHEHSWYMPIAHAEGVNLPHLMGRLGEELQKHRLVFHNGTFDIKLLHQWPGWEWVLDAKYHDTQILAYTFDENQGLKLEILAAEYLSSFAGAEEEKMMLKVAARLGKKRWAKADKAKMYLLDGADVAPYAAIDAWHCVQLLDKFIPLSKADNTWNTYINLLEYQRCLTQMELNGLPVLKDVMMANWEFAVQERDRLEAVVIEMSDGAVQNPGSPAQVGAWLGMESTKREILERYLEELPEDAPERVPVQAVLKHRKWSKAVSTYYKAIAENVGDGDRLYPTLRLTGAAVRLSAANPNTQAIPRAGGEEYRIKDFIGSSDPDMVIIEADFSQAEIVMGAHITEDPFLLTTLADPDFDQHNNLVNVCKLEYELNIERQTAKRGNFAMQYGAGVARLRDSLQISEGQARKLLASYEQIRARTIEVSALAQNSMKVKKFLTLWSGRKRHWYPGFKTHSALNALIQGGVSELMRVAIVRLFKEVPEVKWGLTVHDCVVGQVHKDDVQKVIARVEQAMTDFPWLKVPIKTSIEVGRTWATVEHVN